MIGHLFILTPDDLGSGLANKGGERIPRLERYFTRMYSRCCYFAFLAFGPFGNKVKVAKRAHKLRRDKIMLAIKIK